MARETGLRRGEGINLGQLGFAYTIMGQFEQAMQFYKEALAIACDVGDRREEGLQLGYLGQAYHALGQSNRATKYCQKALTIARETKNLRQEGIWLDSLGLIYYSQGEFKKAIKCHEETLSIARKISNQLGESHSLIGLSKGILAQGNLLQARQNCQKACDLNMPATKYRATLILGTILLYQHDQAARETFLDAVALCQAILDETTHLYQPKYVLSAAVVGDAVCNSDWTEKTKRSGLLSPALTEYQRALEITAAPGVVQDAIRDLELIRAAGVEGLEPIFDLLEKALAKNDKQQPD